MTKISIDADKIRNEGYNLISVSNKLNEILNEMYQKLGNISNNDVWSSENANGSASKFIEKINKDKTALEGFSKEINSVGKSIVNFAGSMVSNANDRL